MTESKLLKLSLQELKELRDLVNRAITAKSAEVGEEKKGLIKVGMTVRVEDPRRMFYWTKGKDFVVEKINLRNAIVMNKTYGTVSVPFSSIKI